MHFGRPEFIVRAGERLRPLRRVCNSKGYPEDAFLTTSKYAKLANCRTDTALP